MAIALGGLTGRIAALLVAASYLTGAAYGHDWWHLGEQGGAPGRVEEFADRDSIRDRGAYLIIDTMLVTESPFAAGSHAMEATYQIDCRRNRSRPIARAALDANGQKMESDADVLSWQANALGSFAADVHALACHGRLPADAFDVGGLNPQLVSDAYFHGE